MKSGIITALDIGSSTIRAAIARRLKNGNIEILGLGEALSDGIEKGAVTDIQALSESIKKALNNAERQADTKADNIFCSITGEHIRAQMGDGRISIPSDSLNEPGEILPEHLEQVINDAKNSVKIQKGFERHKILHGIPHDYIIDNQENIRNPINMNGFHLTAKVLTILGDLTPMRNLLKCIDIAGYEMESENFVLSHIALAESVLSEDEKRLGAILMDIGGACTDISIYNRGSLDKIMMVPMAGQSITEDLAIGLKTTLANAEYIKTEFGSSIASEEEQKYEIEVEGISGRASTKRSQYFVSHVIQRRVEEMLEICYENCKDYYTPELVTAGIILSGGTAKLQAIDTAVHKSFNLNAKIASPNLFRIQDAPHQMQDPAFATLVGTLYYAFDNIQDSQPKSFKLKGISDSKLWDKIKDIIKDFI